ncbi:hypothetical protein B0A49_12203 [Cryomyces minteri]|uniref:Major facilitator superfamily (MFS) profile domain-containing protein n=1 Tax=Cryomyces minteri TaxID=331657 RepID=A0A4U0VW28_9PEZI|nr:hypothetical protein B0A49_12203 [Cryomyces minteri]
MGGAYAREHALEDDEDTRAFELGAILAQKAIAFEDEACRELFTAEELQILEEEQSSVWSHPLLLYLVIALCSVCAAVQGMDGGQRGQLFCTKQFGIGGSDPRSTWLTGLVNSAPYMCSAFVGCWFTIPYNNWFGRRGTIFITCLFSALACFWQGFVNSWWHMFIARFVLGFGIGPKSATVPIYAAECAPPKIRGALVMQWQVWTAFGIMLDYAADLAFYNVPDKHDITGLNWRIMMASAMLPAVIVCCFVFKCPESPRWYMSKGRHAAAYQSLCRLRKHKIQAARDVFYMNEGLKAESEMANIRQSKVREMITVPRNRHALFASEILVFMQQASTHSSRISLTQANPSKFCGVNVIAYYSSEVFIQSGFSELNALAASLGFRVINFIFAIPDFITIDSFGRRNLLLVTFPLMSVCLLFTGFSFFIPEGSTAQVACIALGIYLFGCVYSPGAGPVPFTYSAEAYPLHVRTYGMSLATATTWFFNFILSITWPSMQAAFTNQGAFGWYAAWNTIGFVMVMLFVPETKSRSLEELDAVFAVPTRTQAAQGLEELQYLFNRYILRSVTLEPLIDWEKVRAANNAQDAQPETQEA